MALRFILALLFLSCAAPHIDPVSSFSRFDNEQADLCGSTYSPIPELEQATIRAARRWTIATGCNFASDTYGDIPILMWDRVFKVVHVGTNNSTISSIPINIPGKFASHEMCAATQVAYYTPYRVVSIKIILSKDKIDICGGKERLIMHEIGHAASSTFSLVTESHTQSNTIMHPRANDSEYLHYEDLALVCRYINCQIMKPEQD